MPELSLLIFSTSTAAVLSLGFFIGLKHAVEADHLAAVSTIVNERQSLLSSAIIGGWWGLGHTISLFIAGVFVLLLDFQISELTERKLEFGVGIMLVLLGLNVLRKIAQGGTLHFHTHEHGRKTHVHPHLHEPGKEDEHESHHGLSFNPRAVVIGMIHGLAGSAALMLLVVPTIASPLVALAYILIFGVGSIGGMMLMSFVIGLPFHFTANNFVFLNKAIRLGSGVFSLGLGMFIIYEKLLQG